MVADRDKLPWFDAVCVVLPQLPYLMDECVSKHYRGANLLAGFCYTASEAIHHLSEDPTELWYLRWGKKPHQTHYYLKLTETGRRIDVTASQFPQTDFLALYDYERRRGFGSKEPSRRAQLVLDRIDRRRTYFRSPYRTWSAAFCPEDRGALTRPKRKAEDSNPSV